MGVGMKEKTIEAIARAIAFTQLSTDVELTEQEIKSIGDKSWQNHKVAATAAFEAFEANRPKFWWEDAHLRMPKYDEREKIEEWEACYAFLFTQMNKMVADFYALKNAKKMVEGIDYTKSCGNVFEDLGIIPTSANKITFTLPICEDNPVTVRSGSNKIIFHITPAGEFILGEGAVMSEAAKIFADEVNRFIKQPMGDK